MSQGSCSNCGATITCGCQVRTASDGARVCTNCVAVYEQQIASANNTQA